MQRREEYLDALRGFAITGVIITHVASLAGVTGSARTLASIGGRGVLLFFVVSACTIFMTLTAGVARDRHPFRNFFIKRLMRLLPVYWLGIVLYTVVYGLDSRGWREGPELWHYPLHITLTNVLHPLTSSSVVPGGWSISVEALFYLSVPLWFAIARSWRSAALLVLACCVAGAIVVPLLAYLGGPSFGGAEGNVLRQYWYRSFPSQLGTFTFGILLYFLVTERPALLAPMANRRINLAVLAIAGLGILWTGFRGTWIVPAQYSYGACFMLAAVALAYVPWAALVNVVTCWIGRVSYSAYLAHFLVIKQLSLLIPGEGMGRVAYFSLLFALSFPLTLLLAHLGFRFVEQPTTKLAKRWIARWEARRTSTEVAAT